jgi:small GTP-binding protein
MTSSEKFARYKMVLFGDGGVGKTSLVDRFINDKFDENYISTLGYNVYEKQMPYEQSIISFMIWDIGGQERFRQLRQQYAQGADVAFLVYDITDPNSFLHIKNWKADLDEFTGGIPFILIGNKVDLGSKRQIPQIEGKKLAFEIKALDFLETSAKTGAGIENAFRQLATKTYQAHFTQGQSEYEPL